jgi:hypothetical protein
LSLVKNAIFVAKGSALLCIFPCRNLCLVHFYDLNMNLQWSHMFFSSLVHIIYSNISQVREPPCSHPCPLPCHLSDCPPCKVLVKRPCHCGAMVHAFECVYFNNLKAKEQLKARSCGGPCHRSVSLFLLPNCYYSKC